MARSGARGKVPIGSQPSRRPQPEQARPRSARGTRFRRATRFSKAKSSRVARNRGRDCDSVFRPRQGMYRGSDRYTAACHSAAPAQWPYERAAPAGWRVAKAARTMPEARSWYPRSRHRRLQVPVRGRHGHGKCSPCLSKPRSATSCTTPPEGSAPGEASELLDRGTEMETMSMNLSGAGVFQPGVAPPSFACSAADP